MDSDYYSDGGSSTGQFDVPENTLCSDLARSREIRNPQEDILTQTELEFYNKFQAFLRDLKTRTYATYILTTVSPTNLTPNDNYIKNLRKIRNEIVAAIEGSLKKGKPEYASAIIEEYRKVPSSDILEMYMLNYLELSYYCFPYSQNNNSLELN